MKKKNEIWKYKYRNYELLITLKKLTVTKVSRITLYINGEKVNEGLLRNHAFLEGSLPNGEVVYVMLQSGKDNITCHVIIGRYPKLERHEKDVSDDEVSSIAALGMLATDAVHFPSGKI